MKHTDDDTLSLFGDTPTPAPAAPAKKPRAKRKTTDANDTQQASELATPSAPTPAVEAAQTAEVTTTQAVVAAEARVVEETTEAPNPIEATLHLANSLAPQPRRNSPWAGASAASEGASAKPLEALAPQHKPHVMVVITKGEAGGAQSHVLAVCQALHTQVHFTVVIGGHDHPSVLGQQLQRLGVHVCAMPEMVESMLPWRLWPAVQQLTALIEASPPDLIHAHSAIAGLAARLACQRTARPVVYTVHGFGFKAQVPWLRRQLAGLAERQLSGGTTQMICVSAFERELAHQLPIAPERVHIIPNGIEPLPAHLRKAESADNATTTPRVIMVARMKAPKRHDLLLKALAKVRDWLGHELPVTLAGDGPLRAQHEALAQQLKLTQIHWVGDVSNVAELLAEHDVFVLLSDHEGMPITVLEAMRAGLPIVASDLPGLHEQLMNSQEGLLVANTEQAVAQHLLRLAQDPALRQRLGAAAQQRFETTFTRDQMAERVMAVYQQCLREDGATSRPKTNASHHAAGSALVSSSVRRRDALQSWALWGAWLLLPSLWVTQALESAGLVTYQFGDTLLWCVLPYAVAAHLLMRASHLPVAERSGVLWVSTSAPFVLTPLGFALLQQPYSRAAVIWAYAVTTLWLWLGYHRLVKHRALRLVHLDANVPAQLASYLSPHQLDPQAVHLQYWNLDTHVPLPACDGVVLDRHVPPSDARTRLLSQLKMQHLRLYSVEAVAELTSGRKMLPHASDTLWEIDNDPGYDRIKRLLDLGVVIGLSPLWVPLAAAVGFAVRYDSKGPALFSQQRVGRDGQAFTLWKFRSMVHGLQAPGVHFAQAEDPRITRVGRFLRRTRLDELPQLWNVLRGHMSLIGPRPEQAAFVREFAGSIPSYPYRHLVRPGLTGWAQVQHGYADSADSTRIKLSYDLYYVAHYSLALDLLIAAKTVKTVFTGFGAR